VRGWWSGGLDRTREAAFELKVRRRGAAAPETIPLAASGELFELEEQLRRVVPAFRERRALVSAEEARRAVAVCLAAEQSVREGREIPLAP
jgi:predicted dehydrogenase